MTCKDTDADIVTSLCRNRRRTWGLGTCPAVAWGPGHVAPLLTLALSVPGDLQGLVVDISELDSGHSRAGGRAGGVRKAQWVRRRAPEARTRAVGLQRVLLLS